jgi:hypothetical protein
VPALLRAGQPEVHLAVDHDQAGALSLRGDVELELVADVLDERLPSGERDVTHLDGEVRAGRQLHGLADRRHQVSGILDALQLIYGWRLDVGRGGPDVAGRGFAPADVAAGPSFLTVPEVAGDIVGAEVGDGAQPPSSDASAAVMTSLRSFRIGRVGLLRGGLANMPPIMVFPRGRRRFDAER